MSSKIIGRAGTAMKPAMKPPIKPTALPSEIWDFYPARSVGTVLARAFIYFLQIFYGANRPSILAILNGDVILDA